LKLTATPIFKDTSIIRIFYAPGSFAVQLNTDKCSSIVLNLHQSRRRFSTIFSSCFSSNVSQYYVHVRTRFPPSKFLIRLWSILTMMEIKMVKIIITTRVNWGICHVCNIIRPLGWRDECVTLIGSGKFSNLLIYKTS
jgi:hypothetical protein